MAVSAPGDSPIDSAWRTRIPQGWIQFPDGSFGPPNGVGSDWNAPYRQPPVGVGPAGGASGAVGPLGGGPPPAGGPPSGGTTLNSTEPDIIPPQNSTIPRNKSVGPFTGGTSTENAPGGSQWDPRNWFKGGQAFTPGQPIDGAGGGFNPTSLIGGGNPYWRGIIAAGGVLSPTPAETGEFNPPMVAGRPDAPMGGVHGLPAPTPQTYPHMPWPDTGVAKPAAAAAPKKGRINPGSVNLGRGVPGVAAPAVNPGWGMIDRPNMSANAGGRGGGGPPGMGAFDFSSLFNHPAVAAAAAAHPNVQAHVAARVAGPLAIGSPAPAVPPPRPKPPSSTSSQGGGY